MNKESMIESTSESQTANMLFLMFIIEHSPPLRTNGTSDLSNIAFLCQSMQRYSSVNGINYNFNLNNGKLVSEELANDIQFLKRKGILRLRYGILYLSPYGFSIFNIFSDFFAQNREAINQILLTLSSFENYKPSYIEKSAIYEFSTNDSNEICQFLNHKRSFRAVQYPEGFLDHFNKLTA